MGARRIKGLRFERSGDEIWVVKPGAVTGHALNQSAAVVFELCDGENSKAEMAAAIQQRTGLPADETIVDLALSELVRAGLVVDENAAPVTTRRKLIRQFALSGAALVLLPVVETILLGPLAKAQSTTTNSSSAGSTGSSSSSTSSSSCAGANMSGGNFSGFDLHGQDLHCTNFSEANLLRADLSGANLMNANLTDANLNGANLMGANLMGADLTGANLRGANLSDTILTDAILTDANLHGASLSGVTWGNTTCPDGTNTNTNGAGTCVGHL